MSRKMAVSIAVYGVVLAALGVLVQQTAPAFAKTTFLAATAGGGLCVLWGIVAFAGHQRRTWVVLTMIAVAVMLLSQVVQAWLGSVETQPAGLSGRFVPPVMLVMTVGMLMYVLHGERTPEFYEPRAVRRNGTPPSNDPAEAPSGGRRP
jgi:peptidoglycan/LPS O-acetylase OafA/YrhL